MTEERLDNLFAQPIDLLGFGRLHFSAHSCRSIAVLADPHFLASPRSTVDVIEHTPPRTFSAKRQNLSRRSHKAVVLPVVFPTRIPFLQRDRVRNISIQRFLLHTSQRLRTEVSAIRCHLLWQT